MTWEIGISTGVGYRAPIADSLQPIRDAGFRRLEVSTAPNHLDLRRLEKIEGLRRDMDRLDLKVIALHAPFGPHVDLTSPDAQMRRRSLDQMERAADALTLFGGRLFVLHPGSEDHAWIWDREKRLAQCVDSLHDVLGYCQVRGLTLVVETPLPHLLGGQLPDLEWILARLPEHGTGICLDTSHTILGSSLFKTIDRLGHRLVHVQASDNRGVTDDHLPPGDGIVDWPSVLRALEEVRYQGDIVLELAGDGASEKIGEAVEVVRRCQPRLLPAEAVRYEE